MISLQNAIRLTVDATCVAFATVVVVTAMTGLAIATPPPPPPAPEMDPGGLAGALTLLASGILALRARMRR